MSAASIPDEVMVELKFLHHESSKVRGFTPLDDPRRQAGEDFCALVVAVIAKYQVPITALSKMLGASPSAVHLKLGRRGYLPNSPSQKAYKGVFSTGPGPKAECKRGHDTSFDGSRYAGGVCKECKKAAERAKKAKS